jgi:starch synthase
MAPLRIVQLAAEAYPYAKVGGLADVMSGLTRALARLGHDVTLILPRYRQLDTAGCERIPVPDAWRVQLGPAAHGFGLLRGKLPGSEAEVLLLENDHFFNRWSVYNAVGGRPFPDDAERWLFFQKGAIEAMRVAELAPDIIHAHDAQTGLIAAWLRSRYGDDQLFRSTATVYTIHNMAYQGSYAQDANQLADLPWEWLQPGGPLEFHGTFNWMKSGIALSDAVTTVSPTYAREVQGGERGHGLGPVLSARGADFVGVLNGIDTDVWSPSRDTTIPKRYDASNLAGKRACKRALLERVGLPADDLATPLIGFVGRLVPQKGCELFEPVLRDVFTHDVRGVFLGSGADQYEDMLRGLEAGFRSKFRAHIGFDDSLAHWIEAGADIFLMPSRYEPCGLNQMYSMIYGTIPVVHATGGLADTVFETPKIGTGFVFHDWSAADFKEALYRALAAYQDRPRWRRIRENGMKQDFSWTRSAASYVEVFEGALAKVRG